MPFKNTGSTGLTADAFTLRPIVAADAELDYAAVMDSREDLRKWEQSSWPEDDFTLAANQRDVEMLERRHADGAAFTYTVLNSTETQCLGCVYIMATDAQMFATARITPVADRPWNTYDAAVYYWVRSSRLGTATDRALLEALRTWLRQDWTFDGHLIVTNEEFTQQAELIGRTDLELRFEIEEPGKPGRYLAYE